MTFAWPCKRDTKYQASTQPIGRTTSYEEHRDGDGEFVIVVWAEGAMRTKEKT